MARQDRFIEDTGNNIHLLARFTRTLTGHAPTGEYRKRWHPELPGLCRVDNTPHTRIHVLTECTKYDDLFYSYRAVTEYDDSYHTFIDFLKKNPTAFSFEDAPYEPL
ncbi:hypothetical protein M378DRAFT_18607 [Amanita muscaria Koide BX008]|uniref:Uncharacterized protein n=1 Tax=Amanita muscaria (strain Koide BX008) TaxID=946122 RepID=A0A0C2SLF1_AMAMK|nr:hypothetical protein M378DRAFT_18607 [Amanita muscaria Koide BX008]